MSEEQAIVRVSDDGGDGYLLGFKEDCRSFIGFRDVNIETLRKRKWREDTGQRVAPVDLTPVGGLEIGQEWFWMVLAPGVT